MNKENWLKHIAETEMLVLPEIDSLNYHSHYRLWKQKHSEHLEKKCLSCLDRRNTRSAQEARKARHEAMLSLGLTKVKGNLGGTYYE